MGKKNKIQVYYDSPEDGDDIQDLPLSEQRLRLRMEKKGRGGKAVTIISGYEGYEIDDLCRGLKRHIGVGGSVKDGDIIIQGDHRTKAIEWLKKQGVKDVK